MFFDEEMLLEIRLETLNKYVDFFVIVESIFTHNGKPRKLLFDITKFEKFKKKIKYIVHNKIEPNLIELKKNESEGQTSKREIINALIRENGHRNFILEGIKDASDDDIILISDLDEIPDLSKINIKDIKDKIICFKQNFFCFKLNLFLENFSWIGTRACKRKNLISPQWLRNIKDKIYPWWRFDILFSKKKYRDIFFVKNGGWHFSTVKSAQEIDFKLRSYLHHREYDLQPLGEEKIQEFINNKIVFYDHSVDQKQYKFGSKKKLKKTNIEDLPLCVKENFSKYKEWLD